MLCRRNVPCSLFLVLRQELYIIAQLALSSSSLAFLLLELLAMPLCLASPFSWCLDCGDLEFLPLTAPTMRRESQWHWQMAVRNYSVLQIQWPWQMLALRNSLFHLQNRTYKWQIIKHNGIYFESNETIFLAYYRGSNWFDANLDIQWLYWHDSDFFKKNMEKVSKLMNRFYCFTKCCIGSTVEQVVLLCFMLTFSPLPSYSFKTLASVLFTAVKATVLPVSAPVPW